MKARLLLSAVMLSLTTPALARPQVAFTFDDLPVHGPTPLGETPLSIANRTIAALKAAHVPATGFVNGRWSETMPTSMAALRAWRSAGYSIGNHSWSHANLSDAPESEVAPEIIRNEAVLEQFAPGADWRWFRYPFLAEGKDPARRLQIRQLLASRGYRVAGVTMDFGDWQFTGPYARCVERKDHAGIAELKKLYLLSAREGIRASRMLSAELYKRDIPYVLLMHIGALDSYMLPQLLALYRREGFRFVSLTEAESDPVYREYSNPGLPSRELNLDGSASELGLPHPSMTDLTTRLAAICPS